VRQLKEAVLLQFQTVLRHVLDGLTQCHDTSECSRLELTVHKAVQSAGNLLTFTPKKKAARFSESQWIYAKLHGVKLQHTKLPVRVVCVRDGVRTTHLPNWKQNCHHCSSARTQGQHDTACKAKRGLRHNQTPVAYDIDPQIAHNAGMHKSRASGRRGEQSFVGWRLYLWILSLEIPARPTLTLRIFRGSWIFGTVVYPASPQKWIWPRWTYQTHLKIPHKKLTTILVLHYRTEKKTEKIV
jgi:hypothetical protein